MWISKEKYQRLNRIDREQRQIVAVYNDLVRRVRDKDSNEGIFIGENIVAFSPSAYQQLKAKGRAQKDTIMQLTAERDWYKQKYAELLCGGCSGEGITIQGGSAE